MLNDCHSMELALTAARRGAERGQAPFGACLVVNGQVVATEWNRVRERCDVTAHAEIEVLRSAFRSLGTVDLSGAVLYSTCEPCPMCFAACHDARVARIVYGATLTDAERHGFLGFSIPAETLNRGSLRPLKLTPEVLRTECVSLLEQASPLAQSQSRSAATGHHGQTTPVTTLIDQFEHHARTRPQATALRFQGDSLTYAELNARANRLAWRLKQLGVGPETVVALSVSRSFHTLVGILGILKTGGAYVHISHEYPPWRQQQLLEDSQARWLVTADQALTVPPGVTRIELDETESPPAADEGDPPRHSTSDQLCYLMYTSGTTGVPNGVMVTHGNLARLFPEVRRVFDWGDEEIWSMVHTASFGYSVWEIWGALAHGGTLVIVPPEIVRAPEALHSLVTEEGVTILSLTPTAFRLFDWADESSRSLKPLRLKYIVFSGEPLPGGVVRSWLLRHGEDHPQLINTYAATETSGQTVIHRLTSADLESPEALIMGKPLSDVTLSILDGHRRAVMPGETGELFIGGPAVARGYWRRPELTAARFVDIPGDADTSGGRLYRTGDLVCQRTDGVLEFRGRADRQVKLQGFRVEPAEVENLLRMHPGVRDALVVANVDDETGETHLRAYVVAHPPTGNDVTVSPSETGEAEIWPSLGEYQVYDEYLYHVMSAELQQNPRFADMIARHVPGRTVVDLGTGRDALFARLCVQAGARKVYAVEVLESACRDARLLIERIGLSDRIEVIPGDAQTVELPEPADLIVSRLMGNIGSSDGMIPIYRAARRWLRPGGAFLPSRYVTRMAAVSLPAKLREFPCFAPASEIYVYRIFEQSGGPFDLRLCLQRVTPDQILSESVRFEDLDFATDPPETDSHSATLRINRAGRCDGFLLWLTVEDDAGEVADYFSGQQGWLPVFLPAFDGGLPVTPGDRLELHWERRLSTVPPFPEYQVRGALVPATGDTVPFEVRTGHGTPAPGSNEFFRQLHRNRSQAVGAARTVTAMEIRDHLAQRLPVYMRPKVVAFLDAIPMGANGKVDLNSLPEGTAVRPDLESEFQSPRDALERDLVLLWEELLQISGIGIFDGFFELGGSSLIAVQLARRMAETFGVDVPVRTVFDGPTVADMAERIRAGLAVPPTGRDPDALLSLVAELSDEEAARLLESLENSSDVPGSSRP